MRMLLLAVHSPARVPSQRFRIEEFIPHLEANGVTVEYSWALDAAEAKVFYSAAPLTKKAPIVAKTLARRVYGVLPRVVRPKYDVVFLQRESYFLGGPWFEQLATLAAPMIFDFDDSIWIHQVSKGNARFGFLKNTDKIPRLVSMAQTVFAGNAYLADWARAHSSNVEIVPTTIDADAYVPAPRRTQGPVVVGWSGSATTIAHFETAVPVLKRLKAKLGDAVTFKVIGDAAYRNEALGVQGEAWTAATEISGLQAIDIGLMPLPDDEWARGKCGLKGLQYMALGIPTLMSPVGVNAEIIRDGENGYLPKSEDEWVERLEALVKDAALRQRLGDAGRQTVVEQYSVSRWKGRYLELIQAAAASRR